MEKPPLTPKDLHPIARLPQEWQSCLAELAERPFRAQQVFRWIHARGVFDPSQMTDLAAKVRTWLAQENIADAASVERVHRAADKTRKLLIKLADGSNVETVLIPASDGGNDADAAVSDTEDEALGDGTEERAGSERGAGDGAEGRAGSIDAFSASAHEPAGNVAPQSANAEHVPRIGRSTQRGRRGCAQPLVRLTQCISTQVGCAMGCAFCASGVAGLKRHLGAHEIVAQVILGRRNLEPGEELRNIVLMGMGEPLHNYEQVARALRLLTHPQGLNFSPRRITVSTVGLVPQLLRLGEDFSGQIGLAISLHAADDATRTSLLPINRKYPLAELVAALKAYPLPRRRRIFIEYTVVSGKNDTLAEAHKLARLLRGVPVKINLIPMNPIPISALAPPAMDRVYAFQQVLIDAGYTCFVRKRRGDDVSAACGQLALLGARI